MTTTTTWDYEGYWNAVLGYETPASVAASLAGFRADDARDVIDVIDWLARTDSLIWGQAGGGEPMPAEWAQLRASAVAAIVAAGEDTEEQ